MILELFSGALASIVLFALIKMLNFGDTVNRWISSIGKFVYLSGHPLLDDDQRFERIIKAYKPVAVSFSQVILKTVAIILFSLGAIVFIGALLVVVRQRTLPALFSPHFLRSIFSDYLLHWPFIVGTLLPFTLLPFLPRTARDEEYSALEQFLHYLFVGNRGMVKLQFRFECLMHQKSTLSTAPSQHVYISGLARSGSTSLMQYLGQLPQFVSLSYRNMPFVFMPRTGPKLISNKRNTERERSHKDGMRHSLSTYEALEEPFWLHFVVPQFVKKDRLIGHIVTEDVHNKYQDFRSLVAREKTYLAKNNNHLLRAKSLHRLDKEKGLRTRTIIPFRDPYAQARSLLEQHELLSKLQQDNGFALDYMDFLAHHEFGLNLKTLCLDESAGQLYPDADPHSLDHWLDVWYRFYTEAVHIYGDEPDFCFFCYENYLKNPRESLMNLCTFIDVPPEQLKAIKVKEWKRGRLTRVAQPKRELILLYDRMSKEAINHEV